MEDDRDPDPNLGANDGHAGSEEKSFAQVLEEMSNFTCDISMKRVDL